MPTHEWHDNRDVAEVQQFVKSKHFRDHSRNLRLVADMSELQASVPFGYTASHDVFWGLWRRPFYVRDDSPWAWVIIYVLVTTLFKPGYVRLAVGPYSGTPLAYYPDATGMRVDAVGWHESAPAAIVAPVNPNALHHAVLEGKIDSEPGTWTTSASGFRFLIPYED